jgi:hypothetical protein
MKAPPIVLVRMSNQTTGYGPHYTWPFFKGRAFDPFPA